MSAYDFEVELAKIDGATLPGERGSETRPRQEESGGRRVRADEETVKGKLVEDQNSSFVIDCDRVITAIGQEKGGKLAELFGAELNGNGTIKVNDKTLATSNSHVFAGGDAVNGGKEVVNAAADGKRAAWGIHLSFNPGAKPDQDNAYWVSIAIDGRDIAPDRSSRGARMKKPAASKAPKRAKIDLSVDCAGIKSPNPFWLASAPPANSGAQVMRAF